MAPLSFRINDVVVCIFRKKNLTNKQIQETTGQTSKNQDSKESQKTKNQEIKETRIALAPLHMETHVQSSVYVYMYLDSIAS